MACLASEYLGNTELEALRLRDFARHAQFEFGTGTQTIKLTPLQSSDLTGAILTSPLPRPNVPPPDSHLSN